MVDVKVSMVSPNMCDDKRYLTLNTAELLPNMCGNHHGCTDLFVELSFSVGTGDKLWITWPYHRDLSLTSRLKFRILRVYTVGTQRKEEEP